MDIREIERCKVLLESRLEALWERVRNRNTITIENAADTMDEVRLAEDRDLAIQILGRGFAELRLVEAALDRIKDGSYGSCLRCDEPIRSNRLCVIPHATFCVTCQEVAEHNGLNEFSPQEGVKPPARSEHREEPILQSGLIPARPQRLARPAHRGRARTARTVAA